VIGLRRVFQRVLVEVLGAAAELRQGGQLQDSHRPLQDGDGLLVDPLLLRLGSRQISGDHFLGAGALGGAVVLAATVMRILLHLEHVCRETAGFSRAYRVNELFERISLNECISNVGHGFYTKQQNKTYTEKVMA
jgi:hypothetical protein